MSRVEPSSSASSLPPRRGRLSFCFSIVSRIWDTVQVELHGDYPIDHIKAFHAYVERTPWWRALLVCFITPVPGVLFVLFFELFPLEDPKTHDARSSPNVWLRFLSMTIVGSTCVLEQFRQHIPSLELSWRSMLAFTLPSSIVATLLGVLLSDQIAYPMPFVSNIVMGPWLCLLLGLLFFSIRQQLRDNPQLVAELKQHSVVCACQIALAVVYPLYNTVFVRLSAWTQTAFVFLLPCIKMTAKNIISRWLANTDEARSEGVIFNVEVFHALFVSFSMQGSSGMHTIVALMIIDAVHMWLSFRDLHALLKRLEPMLSRQPVEASTRFVSLANDIAEHEPFHCRPSDAKNSSSHYMSCTAIVKSMCSRFCNPKVHATVGIRASPDSSCLASSKIKKSWIRRASSTASERLVGSSLRNLATNALPPELQVLSIRERGIVVRRAQKLFFVTEFIALVEYTEIMVPCLFNMYLLIMFNLSNRPFYDFLVNVSVENLRYQVLNISLYAFLELLSLVVTVIILWRQLGLSLLHQIAFVLEKRQASIQSKVIMWSILVMQYGARQYGVDYTFQFAWLRQQNHDT